MTACKVAKCDVKVCDVMKSALVFLVSYSDVVGAMLWRGAGDLSRTSV